MTHADPSRPGVLDQLEFQAIHIIREVVAQCRTPVLLYSIDTYFFVLTER